MISLVLELMLSARSRGIKFSSTRPQETLPPAKATHGS